ncbi:hypothetical protein [Nitrosomonas communis]|uniref:Uncharacterized protein n=1 Tax=Nitrosomonas communis TaxID=44574 RepID=A0A1I4QXK6_9PROT|nr:hypothetical protein [Nitrosomonas communis]SFM44555.1 hypothetical protein SAMN05421863_10296 [Nitrosomonas communis]
MKIDDPVYEWCRDNGIVRVEVELKRRMLQIEGLDKLENLSDEKIQQIFASETVWKLLFYVKRLNIMRVMAM